MRNMTCARDDECFGDNSHKEHCNVSLSHAREKFARAMRARCGVLFTLPSLTKVLVKKSNYAQYSCHSLDDHQEDDSEQGHHTADEEE